MLVLKFEGDLFQDKNLHPLVWWKDREARMPFISVVTKALFCIPCSSTNVERFFCAAGRVVCTGCFRMRILIEIGSSSGLSIVLVFPGMTMFLSFSSHSHFHSCLLVSVYKCIVSLLKLISETAWRRRPNLSGFSACEILFGHANMVRDVRGDMGRNIRLRAASVDPTKSLSPFRRSRVANQ